MLPKSSFDKTECLENLLGIRTGCTVEKAYPFFIEDIPGLDVSKLATLAKKSNPSGKDFGKQLINTAARQMMGDLEMLLNNGFSMNNIVGDMCSTCSLLPVYTANAGIIIKPTIASRFKIARITKLNILTNVTGSRQLKIDDGVTAKFYNINLVAGELMPVELPYFTSEKSAKVSFTDTTVGLGQVSCVTPSSCGCGGSATSVAPVTITGMVAGIETSTQYGFLPCVAIDCSYDSLVCNLVNQIPNILGLALSYKFGELYFANIGVSDRNTEAVEYGEGQKTDEKSNYSKLYWAKMKANGGMNTVSKLINDYLRKNRADKCVNCEAKVGIAYTTG